MPGAMGITLVGGKTCGRAKGDDDIDGDVHQLANMYARAEEVLSHCRLALSMVK